MALAPSNWPWSLRITS